MSDYELRIEFLWRCVLLIVTVVGLLLWAVIRRWRPLPGEERKTKGPK